MKRILSVLLTICLLAAPIAMIGVSASEPLTNVYYVELPTSETFTCEPLEGYSQYVPEGAEFKFKITPKEGYSLSLVMVTLQTMSGEKLYNIEPLEVKDTYAIDSVTENVKVDVSFVLQKQQANLFRSLFEFLRRIIEWIGRLFNINPDEQAI